MRLLERDHLEAALRQQDCRGAAGRAAADHRYVTVDWHIFILFTMASYVHSFPSTAQQAAASGAPKTAVIPAQAPATSNALRSPAVRRKAGYAEALIRTIFPQPHDVPMDWIVTGANAPLRRAS